MISLRNRIAGVMILAIVAVTALASLAAVQMIRRPLPDVALLPVTHQTDWLVRTAVADPSAARKAGLRIEGQPAPGPVDAHETRAWTRFLTSVGMTRDLRINRAITGPGMVISVDLDAAGGLIMPLPDLHPPRMQWLIFASWLAMIAAGAAVVSVVAAQRITGPLRLLEAAADRIGPDGLLEPLPNTGLPEARATARTLNRLSTRLKSAMESRMRLRAEFIGDNAERDKWLADLTELDTIADSAIRLVPDEVSAEPIQTLRLDGMLAAITAELSAQSRPARLSTPLPPAEIRAQPVALSRALRNLVINAAPHGKGAEVGLRIDGGWAEIRILDHGPGIPEPLLERAFEPLFLRRPRPAQIT